MSRRSLILQNLADLPARSHARYRKDVTMFLSVFYSRNDDPTGSERVMCDAQAKYIYQNKTNVIHKLYSQIIEKNLFLCEVVYLHGVYDGETTPTITPLYR
jgi:hypothetical protein